MENTKVNQIENALRKIQKELEDVGCELCDSREKNAITIYHNINDLAEKVGEMICDCYLLRPTE